MMSRKQVMETFNCSSDEAAIFLNAANEEEILHLEPSAALRVLISKHKKEAINIILDIIKEEMVKVVEHSIVEDHIRSRYNPDVPRQKLD